MKKIYNLLFSTRLTGVLFLLYAASMAIATFIENDFGTPTAKALIYNTRWFELIHLFFLINFTGNIFKYKLWKKEKWSVLVFHLSFVLIILGAAITRYISFEGIMPIYEGETTNVMLSDKAYLNIHIDDDKEQKAPIAEPLMLANKPNYNNTFIAKVTNALFALKGGNDFKIETDFKGKPVSISMVNYIPNAYEKLVVNQGGEKYLKIVESGGGGRHDHYIKAGETVNMHNAFVSYENPTANAINIFTENDSLKIQSPFHGSFMVMASQQQGHVVKDSVQAFHLRALYQIKNLQFVIPEPPVNGKMEMVSGDKDEHPNDLLELKVATDNDSKNITLFGSALSVNSPDIFNLDGLNFRLSYGSKQIELPFSIKLRDFQLERYPGSMSPKSYASEITVVDQANSKTFDYRIFMNHVLDYQGYRFFQSSYNDRGEVEQTFLSVNHDQLGTWTTYLGYALLFFGMLWALVINSTRFGWLRKNLKKIASKKAKLAMLIGLVAASAMAQDHNHEHEKQYISIDSLIGTHQIAPKHAKNFGELVIQDEGGRMKPVNTFASELLRKVSKKDSYNDMDANQVLVSMVISPRAWYFVPFIYIKPENTKLRDLLKIPHDQKYARFSDLFSDQGEYLLKDEVAAAHKKKIKNKYEESVLNVDGRANLLFGALEGGIFRFFPLEGEKNNTWYSNRDVSHAGFKGTDSLYVSKIIPMYSRAVVEAIDNGDYTNADKLLESIHKYQRKFGEDVVPSEKKIKMELFYNKYDIFKSLFMYYMLASLLLFIVVMVHIFKSNKRVELMIKIASAIIIGLFIYHTIGLGVRWYISGHAPWSNGYEAMIYVSWATMLFGIGFGRKSSLTLAATTFVTSMLLMVAHWNWMDPSIGNLVPVLDSYWLMVHVAVIVASYGPFTICMILGMLSMIIYTCTTKSNKKKLKLAIDEITTINEMSMNIGLVLLVIGNFLGGIWANESWGRYWGWDPKETWALISIMIYSFVLHMRLIPGLKGKFKFNILSVFAFTSILMTFLGVNHLLSGLHSYAKGESAAVPNQIWGWLIISVILSILAYIKYKKHYKKSN